MEGSNLLPQASLTGSSTDSAGASSPLLGGAGGGSGEEGRRTGAGGRLSGVARLLRRAGRGRILREPSVLVRETAAEQLERRQSDWANSRPVVVLDLVWNLAFVVVALVVLVLGRHEKPRTPLRVWILCYALQCALHIACVCVEYGQRYTSHFSNFDASLHSASPSEASESDVEYEMDDADAALDRTSFAKRLESANTMFSFVWWLVGFYWITYGGQALIHDSPHLYWICIVFLAFDVFFVVFCVALACVIGIAVCCCLPCIIAILYAVADQEGASEDDISSLPRFKFQHMDYPDKVCWEKAGPFQGAMISISSEIPNGRVLSAEDAECCICLAIYDDGAELRELPCNHHFHCACIDKWLRINSTCPLCKYNIIKNNDNGREEV